MGVEFKSGNSSDLVSVDPVSKAIRATLYNSSGEEGTRELPVDITVSPVTAVDEDIVSSIDVTEFKFLSVQLTGIWEGSVSFQGSNDNGTFYDIVSQDATSTTFPYSSFREVNGLVKVPVTYKFFRARVTAYTSGTVTGTAIGHKEDKTLSGVAQVGQVTLAAESTKVIGTVNVSNVEFTSVGNIIAADTALPAPSTTGGLLTGPPSVNSYVFLALEAKDSTWSAEITGDFGGGTFYFEGSTSSTDGLDGNWFSLNAVQGGKSDSLLVNGTTSEGEFTGNNAGIKYFRVRALDGVGINAIVNIRSSSGTSSVFLKEALPTGTNVIGGISNLEKLGGADVSMNSGVVDAGTQRVSIASDESLNIDNVSKLGGSPVSMNTGVTEAGTQRVTIATDTSLALANSTEFVGKVAVVADPDETDVTDFYVSVAGAVNLNSRVIRAQSCILYSMVMTNYTATARHVKIYDTSVDPVAGQGVPVIVLSLPAASSLAYPLKNSGLAFTNGIGMTMVLGAANNNVTGTSTIADISLTSVFT
jgi:hypothetical protein